MALARDGLIQTKPSFEFSSVLSCVSELFKVEEGRTGDGQCRREAEGNPGRGASTRRGTERFGKPHAVRRDTDRAWVHGESRQGHMRTCHWQ